MGAYSKVARFGDLKLNKKCDQIPFTSAKLSIKMSILFGDDDRETDACSTVQKLKFVTV